MRVSLPATCGQTPYYDTVVSYVGHAERPTRIDVDGDPAESCTVRYL